MNIRSDACARTRGSSITPRSTRRCIAILCAGLALASSTARGVAPDQIFDNGFDDSSAQIAAIRALPDGPLSLPVSGALVTYLKPAIGSDPAGFFLQASPAGPALFVAVDPATTQPPAQVGDRVSMTVTALATLGGLREVTAISAYARQASGIALTALIQDLSTASDVVSALDQYESELIAISGALPSAPVSSGAGFVEFGIQTTGIPAGDAALVVRVPAVLADGLDIAQGCTLGAGAIPMWRFNTKAEPSPHAIDDISALACPAPRVVSAVALSSTSVRVRLDRHVDAGSVANGGNQFTFDHGLAANAAAATERDVIVGTSAQTAKTMYQVTVATSVTDTLGVALDGTATTATFIGFQTRAELLLNEINSNLASSHDLVELRALTAGSTLGIALLENPASAGGGTVLATLPDITVAIGDLIVVHLAPTAAVTDETSTKSDCTDVACYPNAWDIRGGATGLNYSDRVVALRDATGALIDAVAFVRTDVVSTPAAFPPAVQYVQSLGLWLPADCNGAPCTFDSLPSVVDISMDWAGLGTLATGASASRHAVIDSNQASDWQIRSTSTFGAANP